MRKFQTVATLQKSATVPYQVGGVASSFHRDLDGEAILPDAVRRAIPSFMAARGPGGVQGGPIRLHHNFWEGFLKRAIASVSMPFEKQSQMMAAIALPLGRVTKIWVDDEGKTHWQGLLSMANPISEIVWKMLQEGLLHLGVSLGGKIFSTQAGGRDALGRPCTLITDIRIDELSVTDNPALRLTENEDTGAYISALAKSVRSVMSPSSRRALKPKRKQQSVSKFLAKALGDARGEFASLAPSDVPGGMSRGLDAPKGDRPKGKSQVKTQSDSRTGYERIDDSQAKTKRKQGQGASIKTQDSVSVEMFARGLSKACKQCDRQTWEGLTKSLTDGSYALAALTPNPPDVLVNLMRLMQHINQFCMALPSMDDYQAQGTIGAMSADLSKSLLEFTETMPKELLAKPLRPPGSPAPTNQTIQFPKQYLVP